MSREAVAIHEAAHVVIARHESIKLVEAVLKEDGTGGSYQHEGLLDSIDIDHVENPRDRRLVERVVKVKLAGAIAQHRKFPNSDPGDGADRKSALGLITPFAEMSGVSPAEYLADLGREVADDLEHMWSQVEAVAQGLLAVNRLEGEEVVRLCEAASRGTAAPRFREVQTIVRDRHGLISRIIKSREPVEDEEQPRAPTAAP